MVVLGVIPARFESTRFPGKPLAEIAGKPLLQWVVEGSLQAKRFTQILVATDDKRIAELAEKIGVEAVMTDKDIPTGSDRVWATVRDRKADVVTSIQGDEPLISGELLDKLVEPFFGEQGVEMTTLGSSMDQEGLESINSAKIVLNQKNEALYFSRLPIPFSRQEFSENPDVVLRHIGMYAYRFEFLEKFCQSGPVALEKAESLEQLRALYLGARIRVVQVEDQSWGVDTPQDVIKVEKLLKQKGLA